MKLKFCLNCFRQIDDDAHVCPYCHYQEGTPPAKPTYLMPGTIFADHYIIGTALGSGGFSVTYKAFDYNLNKVVAIKEYLPMDVCRRSADSDEVVVFSDEEKEETFLRGKEKFEEEAKRMARFQGVDHIVQVYDTVEANNTCYIIMEYLDGETVESFVKRHGKVDEAKALRIIVPVLEALQVIHSQKMLHRDVSPSNIMLLKDGDVKLLDFGSARYTNTDYSQSLTVLFKEGFTPEEQYYRNGHQGPWSDVYSAGATLYYILTGVVIDSALDRKISDTIMFPSMFALIHRNVETAIMNALSVDYRSRTQSAHEMRSELLSETSVDMHYIRNRQSDAHLVPKPLKIIAPLALTALLAFVVAVSNGAFIHFDEQYVDMDDAQTQIPSLIGLSQKDAMKVLNQRHMKASFTTVNDPNSRASTVLTQSLTPGTIMNTKNRKVAMKIATGETKVMIPRYSGLNAADYIQQLKENHLTKVVTVKKHSDVYAPGAILSLEGEDAQGQSVNVGVNKNFSTADKLIVNVAKVEKVAHVGQATTVPKLVKHKINGVAKALKKAGLKVIVDHYENDDLPVGTILKTDALTNSQKKRGDVIHVTLSAGKLTIKMPDIRGLSRDEAISRLEAANVQSDHIRVSEEDSTAVKKHYVISQNGTQGMLMAASAYVDLTVSRGFEVPNVVGNDASSAIATLQNSGLNVDRQYTYTPGYDNDTVTATGPNPGQYVSHGDTVEVYIQKDNALIDSSYYEGMLMDDCLNDLKAKGFLYMNVEYSFNEDIEEGHVISVSPSGNQKLTTTITVKVSEGSLSDQLESWSDNANADDNSDTYTDTNDNNAIE